MKQHRAATAEPAIPTPPRACSSSRGAPHAHHHARRVFLPYRRRGRDDEAQGGDERPQHSKPNAAEPDNRQPDGQDAARDGKQRQQRGKPYDDRLRTAVLGSDDSNDSCVHKRNYTSCSATELRGEDHETFRLRPQFDTNFRVELKGDMLQLWQSPSPIPPRPAISAPKNLTDPPSYPKAELQKAARNRFWGVFSDSKGCVGLNFAQNRSPALRKSIFPKTSGKRAFLW